MSWQINRALGGDKGGMLCNFEVFVQTVAFKGRQNGCALHAWIISPRKTHFGLSYTYSASQLEAVEAAGASSPASLCPAVSGKRVATVR